MEAQLDKLIVDFAQAVRKLAGNVQSISVTLEIQNNRLNWNAMIQQTDEDQVTYTKNRALPRV